jgi:hypothetical protein
VKSKPLPDQEQKPPSDTGLIQACAASASFTGFTHIEAVGLITEGIREPSLGVVSSKKIQLCPQNRSTLGEEECSLLVQTYPATEFRVHANTSCGGKFGIHDASSDWGSNAFQEWKALLKRACVILGAPAYSWHAGRSERASLGQAIARTMDLEQELGIPVGVEGLYPSESTGWLMSSFEDYKTVMGSGARYAIDLSHWQIIAKKEQRFELELLEDLLTHPQCIEIHVSDNDGRRDNHQPLARKTFWIDMMQRLQAHGRLSADVFSEGLQASKRSPENYKKNVLY